MHAVTPFVRFRKMPPKVLFTLVIYGTRASYRMPSNACAALQIYVEKEIVRVHAVRWLSVSACA